jgi:hypothetical protein
MRVVSSCLVFANFSDPEGSAEGKAWRDGRLTPVKRKLLKSKERTMSLHRAWRGSSAIHCRLLRKREP